MTPKHFFTITFLCAGNFLFAQTLADFETAGSTPVLSPAGVYVVANPDINGNPSSKVAYYLKPSGNWQAIYMNFSEKKNIGKNDRLTFKLRSSTKGRVFVKVVNNGTTILESWAPLYNFQPEPLTWTECTMDVSSITDQEFDRIEINASVDNTAQANVYVDDLKLINSLSPNGEPIIDVEVSASEITQGESIQFDASGSVDHDGTITSFEWNFGDGTTGSSDIENHTYATDGIYFVTLKVGDNDGHFSSWRTTVSVLPATGKLGKITFTSANPLVFEKVEGIFLVKGTYSNVYDPDVVKVDAIITQPDLTTLTVPCFFYEKAMYTAITDEWTKANGTGYWMLRFSSSQAGQHQVQLQLTDGTGTTTSGATPVILEAHDKNGYIRIDSQNKQYYRHTTGEPFYPIGINAAWDNTSNYTSIIKNLGAGGANLVRYWQVPFDHQGLEWRNGYSFYKGLGVYSQEAAAEQDSIFSLCESNNVYLQITLFQHGMFSETVNTNWGDNPYNSANGGPLAKSEEYFYNANAKARTKKLLRYIVARWGYSTNLFAWELFNEVNFTGNFPNQTSQWLPGVMNWHDEMGQYIKSLDSFDHPVTTSSDESHLDDMDKLTGLDIVQYHLYNTNLLTTQISKDKTLLSTVTRTGVINGEYGMDVTTADVPMDVQRVAIWTGIMTQVPHLMWLWENYVNTSWSDLFKYPAQYLSDEDFVTQGALTDWVFDVKLGTSKLASQGFRNDKDFYAIVYDASNRNNLTDVICNFTAMPSGNYTITLYNILTGATTAEDVDISGDKQYTLPTFSKGVAIKAKFNHTIVVGGEDPVGYGAIKLYPNPTSDFLQVDISQIKKEKVEVQMSDVMGKRIFSSVLQQKDCPQGIARIELKNNSMPAGVYLLKFTIGQASFTRRFVYVRQ